LHYGLYTFLGWLFIIIGVPFFIPYCLITGQHLDSLKQRFGFFKLTRPWQHSQRVWLHAASVGEVQVAKALILEGLQTRLPADYIITTVTRQGHLLAQSQLGGKALCLYAPIDLPWVIRLFLRKLQPTAYVCLETELWPNILRITHNCGIKTILLNGRMSEKSFSRYKKFSGFSHQVLECLDAIAVIHDTDKGRYSNLGYPEAKIAVTGNAKYALREHDALPATNSMTDSSTAKQLTEATQRQYRELLRINAQEPVLIAGSTHSGEEFLLAKLHAELSNIIPGLVLIIAPRHLERVTQIQRLLDDLKMRHQTFSAIKAEGTRHASIILLDAMGELSKLYATATYVFCGGSLVEKGGHNIMEPARQGKAPIYGPHMKDFVDAVTLLEADGAGFMVADGAELKGLLCSFANTPEALERANEKARATAYAQQGSARKQFEMLQNILIN
jgi:3-deoxy-D-manno-octulosonic-acid transferase